MALTDANARAARPREKSYKLYDDDGLFLLVTPAGGRLWRFRYRFAGKQKELSLGHYPRVGLQEARRKRNSARQALEDSRDPAAEKADKKRAARAAILQSQSFESVANEWHSAQAGRWSKLYAYQVGKRLEEEIFPKLGQLPIAQIEPTEVLAVLKEVEKRGVHETTRRLRAYCSSIFRFGIASGYCRYDPAAHLGAALKSAPKPVHYASLSRDEVGEFLIRLEFHDCEPLTRLAIRLIMLTALRTKELRGADWSEFERLDQPDRALWRVPPLRMKMSEEHLVPLSRQAVDLLLTHPGAAKRSGKVFPGPGLEGVMSNNTMLFALYRMGYKGRTTTHGFRGLFSTEANENGFESDWVERQLAHDERDEVRAAYNAAQYLPQRRKMMQWWADYLDGLREEEKVRRLELRKVDPEAEIEVGWSSFPAIELAGIQV
jgi:integrase